MINSSRLLKQLNQAQNLYEKLVSTSDKFVAYKNWMYTTILKPKACFLARSFEKLPTEIDKQFAKQFVDLDLISKIDYYLKSIIYAYQDEKKLIDKQHNFQDLTINQCKSRIYVKAFVSYNKKPQRQAEIYIQNQYIKSEDASDIDLKYYFMKRKTLKPFGFHLHSAQQKFYFRSIRQDVYPKHFYLKCSSIQSHQTLLISKAVEKGHRKLIQNMKQKNKNTCQKILKIELAERNQIQQHQNTKSHLIRNKKVSFFSDPAFKTISQTQSYSQPKPENDTTVLKLSTIIKQVDNEVQYLTKQYCSVPNNQNANKPERQVNRFQNFMLKGDWSQQKSGDIYLSNKQILKEQDAVVKYMMKKITGNLFGGKNLTTISLPVNIFKPESHTQSMAKSFTLGPHFLQKAAHSQNPLQRMKYVLAFAHSHMVLYFQPEKPFNPILGQTFQGYINGCPIYCEQISHHPPITSIYFVGRGYKFYASIQEKMSTGLNCIIGHHFGLYNVLFQDGQKVCFTAPKVQLAGVVFGKRKFSNLSQEFIFDYQNNLFGEISFEDSSGLFSSDKWKYKDQFQGQIYQTSGDFINEFINSRYTKQIGEKHKLQKHCRVQGRIAHFLNFDGKTYYDVHRDMPYFLEEQLQPLMSHPNLRKDILYKKINDLETSQRQKELLEELQRRDAKLRKEHRKI